MTVARIQTRGISQAMIHAVEREEKTTGVARLVYFRGLRPFGPTDEEKPRIELEQYAGAIATATAADFDRILLRLNTKDRAEVFSTIDRQRAEADLRWAVALPLAVLGLVLSYRFWSASTGLASLTAIALVAISGLLWWRGGKRDDSANMAIVDSLRLTFVNAPAVERIERALPMLMTGAIRLTGWEKTQFPEQSSGEQSSGASGSAEEY
jgi:hypothetical protein